MFNSEKIIAMYTERSIISFVCNVVLMLEEQLDRGGDNDRYDLDCMSNYYKFN